MFGFHPIHPRMVNSMGGGNLPWLLLYSDSQHPRLSKLLNSNYTLLVAFTAPLTIFHPTPISQSKFVKPGNAVRVTHN